MFLGHNNDEDTYYRSYDPMLALLFLHQAAVHLSVRVYPSCFHQTEVLERYCVTGGETELVPLVSPAKLLRRPAFLL